MDEAEHLRERARSCHRIARSLGLPSAVRQLEERAAEFERQAADLESRLANLR